jgi:hypothetical protein
MVALSLPVLDRFESEVMSGTRQQLSPAAQNICGFLEVASMIARSLYGRTDSHVYHLLDTLNTR